MGGLEPGRSQRYAWGPLDCVTRQIAEAICTGCGCLPARGLLSRPSDTSRAGISLAETPARGLVAAAVPCSNQWKHRHFMPDIPCVSWTPCRRGTPLYSRNFHPSPCCTGQSSDHPPHTNAGDALNAGGPVLGPGWDRGRQAVHVLHPC